MIYGIILAAGEGKRMGKVKLTLPLGDKQLIEWVLRAVKYTPLDKYFLVVRPEDKEIIKTGEKWGAEIVLNPEYKSGMSSSIQKALLQISPEDLEGFFLILGDQPLITSEIINKLIKSFSPGKREIVIPYFKNKRGNPVLFDIYWKDELMAVTGDVGGRVLVKAHPEKIKRVNISDETILFDIDQEKDYLKAQIYLKLLQNRREN